MKNQKDWDEWVKKNDDPYGKACVDVARGVMKILDNGEPFDCHGIISQANKDTEAGGITGFMAGCVAQMVSHCHDRGENFRRQWNVDNQIQDEGDKANESGEVLNPALLNISV